MTRRGGLGSRQAAVCALLPVLIDLALEAKQLPAVLAGGLINPDSYMRLVRLQETLQAHQPAYIVPRDGSGHGTLLHWSHLLDSLVCVLAVPFGWFLPQHAALQAAALLAGPIFLGGLGYAIAWSVAPFVERRLLWFGPLLAALSPAIASYGMAGVLHHHVAVVIAAVMAGGWAARIIAGLAPPRAGWALGAWAATGIWFTPESMPLVLLAFGGLWLVWVATPARTDIAAAIRATGAAFLLVLAAAFAVDPPYQGYASVEIYRLSILFAGLGAAVACVAASTVPIDRVTSLFRLRLPARIIAAALAGGICAAAWVAGFPVVLQGTDSMIGSADWHAMFDHIAEMGPVIGPANALRYLLTGGLAALLLAWLAIRHRSLPLAYAALCALALLIVGQSHVRFTAYPEAVAAVMLPVAIAAVERHLSAAREAARSCARLAVVVLFILVPSAGGLPGLFSKAQASETAGQPTCAVGGLAGMLAPYAGQVVLANVNDSPELLYRTGVLTVGSLYLNVPGFLRLRDAWRSLPSGTVPQSVAASGASLVLFCPVAHRSPLIGDLPPDTLLDRLNRHEVPAWLRQVAADPASGNVLYRVVR